MKPWDVASYLIENRIATRVRHGKPCPVCGRDSWCLATEDGSAALCARSDGSGSQGRYGEYGFLYLLSPEMKTNTASLPPVVKKPTRSDIEMDAIWRPRAERWRERSGHKVAELADKLGVSVEALCDMRVGWDGKAWTFPERNAEGLVVGVSRRFVDGEKRCARGSRRGLTYGDGWSSASGPMMLVEGASDVAAGITLGLCVVGRPSNTGGLKMLSKMLEGVERKVVVVGERDRKTDGRWPGMTGGRSLAGGLVKALGRPVSVCLPPGGAKDLRGWLNGYKGSTEDARKDVAKHFHGKKRRVAQ